MIEKNDRTLEEFHAKQLAEEEGVSCEFEVMDAEHLDYTSESYDVVISRKLTWTLPHADLAYEEWIRVRIITSDYSQPPFPCF